MRLRNRLVPADIFTDSRLLNVSPKARALALVLESLAEDSGVLVDSALEIRSSAGTYLSDEHGTLPTIEQIDAWLAELTAVCWLLPYEDEDMTLAYLQGFGRRQQGPNVGLAVSRTTGEMSPHLPLPPVCVRLDEKSPEAEKWRNKNRVRVVHCERQYAACRKCLDNPGTAQTPPRQHQGASQGLQEELKDETKHEVDEEDQVLEQEEEEEESHSSEVVKILDRLELSELWRVAVEEMLEDLDDRDASNVLLRAHTNWCKTDKAGSVVTFIRECVDAQDPNPEAPPA